MCHKLKELGIASVRDVRGSSKDLLQRELGAKTGAASCLCPQPVYCKPTSCSLAGAENNRGQRALCACPANGACRLPGTNPHNAVPDVDQGH